MTMSFLRLSILIFAEAVSFCPAVFGQTQEIREIHQQLPGVKDSIDYVDKLNRLGMLYRNRNADSCLHYGLEAKRIASNLAYRKGQADADLVIVFALFKRGLYAESLELLSRILPYFEKHRHREQQIRAYLDLVEIYNKDISERDSILSLLQRTLHLGKSLEKDSILTSVYLSYITRNTKLPEDSIRYYLDESRRIAARYNDRPSLAYCDLWYTRLMMLNGQKEQALPLIQQLITDAKNIGNAMLEINMHFLAILYYHDRDPEMALQHCYKALEVAQKSGDISMILYILENTLEIAEGIGDKDEMIRIYAELSKAFQQDWENSKKFFGDYVQYSNIQYENQLLQAKTARRSLWLIVVSLSAIGCVLTIYMIMQHRNRKARAQIETLNNIANMQIVAMEEAKFQAIRDERRRMGQELHDNLASAIAGVRHQLEVLALDSDDAGLKHKLHQACSQVTLAYEIARSKSHEWFQTADSLPEQSFEQRIKLLTESTLPDHRYRKHIVIDDHSLQKVDADTRIILLRIIQEAVTNIIKHARTARNVGILVFEETDQLYLVVSDDGKGMSDRQSAPSGWGMGLQSIRRRVNAMKGNLQVRSGTMGTELTVSIPLTHSLAVLGHPSSGRDF